MADPFSIAGTAVGITSLGIQVCQGLFQYYAKFRGLHDEIDDILRRVEGLEGILKSLEPLIKRYEHNANEAPSQLQLALRACEKALQKLREITEKCGRTEECDSLQDRLRLVRKRLLWPFKKDTLRELQNTLSGFQSHLSLALQSLGLDDILRRLESIQDSTTVLVDRTTRIESQVDIVNQNICQSSSEQQQQTSLVYEEVSMLRAQIANQTMVIERMSESWVCFQRISICRFDS
jgi:archaellum component FlaC